MEVDSIRTGQSEYGRPRITLLAKRRTYARRDKLYSKYLPRRRFALIPFKQQSRPIYRSIMFTKHQDLQIDEKADAVSYTISLLGGKNSTGQAGTTTLADVSSDDILRRYMEMFTEFKIVAVKHQFVFNHTGNFDIRPMTITSAYSPNAIIHPMIDYDKINAMNTVKHQGTDTTFSTTIQTAKALKGLGIEWCGSEEWLTGKFGTGTDKLYGDQLPIDRGASLHIKVSRASKKDAVLPECTIGRAITQWVLIFRGRKGVSDITVGPGMVQAPMSLPINLQLAMDPQPLGDLNRPNLFNN